MSSSVTNFFETLSKSEKIGAGVGIGVAGLLGLYAVANIGAFHRGENGFGSCSTAAEVLAEVDLRGRIGVITGASNGIGKEVAIQLAKKGATLWLPARTLAASLELTEELTAVHGIPTAQLIPAALDLADLETVRAFALRVVGENEPLDFLVNNAGVMALPERQSTKQGIEVQVGVNHVGHFLLTELLLPMLKRCKSGARIVNVSSMAHRLGTRDALLDAKLETVPYTPFGAYGTSKLANIVHARELNERHAQHGVQAFSLHPGGILTGLGKHTDVWLWLKYALFIPFAFKSIPQGAATTAFCVAHPLAARNAGGYFVDCNRADPTPDAKLIVEDPTARKSFFEHSRKLVSQYLGY